MPDLEPTDNSTSSQSAETGEGIAAQRAVEADAASGATRIASIDAVRGLTILTMVFVNDVGPAAPAWTHHIQPSSADGMTVADVVFPAFLFIVGMSIPIAMHRGRERGIGLGGQLWHVASRAAALLLMGIVQYNRAADVTLGEYWWGLLAFVAILLGWCVVPREVGKQRNTLLTLKIAGIVGFVALLAIYRREPVATTVAFYGDMPTWVWLRTGWWGILGLIGWAYLTVAILYLILGARREWLMGAMASLMAVYLADRSGGFFNYLDSKSWLTPMRPAIDAISSGIDSIGQYVDLGSCLGSLAAITMAGCLLGTILLPCGGLPAHAPRIRWAAVFAAGLFVAGLVTDTFAGINKIGATPTWCFWSAAIVTAIWTALYILMDVRGYRAWSIVVRPAGANPLIAYLFHPDLNLVPDTQRSRRSAPQL